MGLEKGKGTSAELHLKFERFFSIPGCLVNLSRAVDYTCWLFLALGYGDWMCFL